MLIQQNLYSFICMMLFIMSDKSHEYSLYVVYRHFIIRYFIEPHKVFWR